MRRFEDRDRACPGCGMFTDGEPCPCEELSPREFARYRRFSQRRLDPLDDIERVEWRCPRCRHVVLARDDTCSWCEMLAQATADDERPRAEVDDNADRDGRRSGNGAWLLFLAVMVLLGSGGVLAGAHGTTQARAGIDAIVQRDAAAVTGLAGHWVVQAASWRIRPDGEGDDEVLRELQRMQSDGSAVTFRSDRFATYPGELFWVTVRAQAFPTADAADRWCAERAAPPDHCRAVHLDS